MFNVMFGSFVRDNPAWISRHDCVIRDIEVNVCAGTDHYVVPNFNSADHDSVGANPNAVSNLRHALTPSPIALSNHDTRREIDVASHLALGMNGQVSEVANVKSRSNLCAYRDIKAILVSVMIKKKVIEKCTCNAQPARPVTCRLTLAQEIAEPEARNVEKSLPEGSSIIAPAIAPKVSTDRRFEVYRQSISRTLMINELYLASTLNALVRSAMVMSRSPLQPQP